MRIALATSAAFPDLYSDDDGLVAALRALGVSPEPVVWDDPGADWAAFDLTVVRSTWDYHERRDDFVAWAHSVPRLANPAKVVEWNTDKTYLSGLPVPVVPTAWSPAVLADVPWEEVVVKPAVSAGARNTLRCSRSSAEGQALLEQILANGVAMVQPYLPSVEDHGERSLLFVEGAFTHAVRRNPALSLEGESRYDARPVDPADDELALALSVLEAVGEPLLYARVDVVRGFGGEALLIELEVTEPQMFLRYAPHAAEALAAAAVARAGSAGSSRTSGS